MKTGTLQWQSRLIVAKENWCSCNSLEDVATIPISFAGIEANLIPVQRRTTTRIKRKEKLEKNPCSYNSRALAVTQVASVFNFGQRRGLQFAISPGPAVSSTHQEQTQCMCTKGPNPWLRSSRRRNRMFGAGDAKPR
ncbi:hypothetical protein PIB30_048080 [Stylosanthes scabra]|uniref:Uncharacterized protein n=1 Tax=Stylosanthes scabra TaxID=79078 RepID=A0ABU6VH08_9FABA|nr:hypothetical protein [Stylosanthes scabra]